MKDIEIYISAEDAVTKAVIKRLLAYCSSRFKVLKDIPARGGEVKKKILELNRLAKSRPVVLLTDLDTADCAPLLKQQLLKEEPQNADFLMNIAIDEAEAWLMADRDGFAKYFGFDVARIPLATPQKMGGMKALIEMSFSAKSSWILTHELAQLSSNDELKQQIAAQGAAAKGKEYNSAILPFIEKSWDIDAAKTNSDSLQRMVARLRALESRYR